MRRQTSSSRAAVATAVLAVAALALLAGCARGVVDGTGPDSGGAGAATGAGGREVPAVAAPTAGAQAETWRVERDASLLTLRVYRAGPMARLGHNHVIASRHLGGSLRHVAGDPAQSRLSLTIPVALLTVDEPELRAAAGAEFADPLPDEAREGTRRNMLGPSLLDAVRFPGIAVETLALRRAPDGDGTWIARMAVVVRDQRREIDVPLEVRVDGSTMDVRAATRLRQTDLGLVPFSVMMGALQVQDEMQLDLRLRLLPERQ